MSRGVSRYHNDSQVSKSKGEEDRVSKHVACANTDALPVLGARIGSTCTDRRIWSVFRYHGIGAGVARAVSYLHCELASFAAAFTNFTSSKPSIRRSSPSNHARTLSPIFSGGRGTGAYGSNGDLANPACWSAWEGGDSERTCTPLKYP